MHRLEHGAVCLILGKNDPRICLLCLSVLKRILFQHTSYPTRREKTPIYMNQPDHTIALSRKGAAYRKTCPQQSAVMRGLALRVL